MPRAKLHPHFVADREPGHRTWAVGHHAWFLAGRSADDGWDCIFLIAFDSPEFTSQAEAEAEAARRNLGVPATAQPTETYVPWR